MENWEHVAQLLANLATAFGLIIGAITAWFALLSYRSQLRMQADAHAHDLIRDLLRVNMDAVIGEAPEADTFRLYTLEELVDWVREQQRDLKRWGWLQNGPDRERREAELRGWDETLKTHLEATMRDRVNACPECYGADFLNFVITYAPR